MRSGLLIQPHPLHHRRNQQTITEHHGRAGYTAIAALSG